MTTVYEELFEYSPVAELVVRRDGEIVLVNRHAERLFDHPRSWLIGRKIEALVPEAVRATHPVLVEQYFESPSPRGMGVGRDLYAVKQDGSQFPVEIGLNPILIDEVRHVLVSVIDITERRRAEDRFRTAVEAAPNGMLMVDSGRRIVLANRTVEEIFGYARDELLGRSIEDLVPDEYQQNHPALVDAFFRNPERRAMGTGRDLHGRHKSGRLVPVEVGLQPIHFEDAVMVISSVVDISARKRAEAEIRRKTEEIEEFSYRTSHDLRSPLKSIAGMADVALENLDSGETVEARDCVTRIKGLCDRLMVLIEDILTLTRVDMTDEPIGEFDWDTYARTVTEKFRSAIDEGAITFECAVTTSLPVVVQPTRLTQVLDNLIGNSIKYADPRKPTRWVRLEVARADGHHCVSVADNGTGIPAEHQQEAFDMFKRFHGPSIPGSGLGLSIVKKQIQRLGASITLSSSAAGTTFRIDLPDHPRSAQA